MNLIMILFFSIFVSSSFIGFDIGSETIKAAAIRSGRSIEIILNEQSKRKTPGLVSFETNLPITVENVRNITRRVGFSATSVLLRNQSAVVRAIPEIIGKRLSPELQSHFDNRYYGFKMNGTLVNGIEPHVVLAMLLDQFVHHAESQLQQGNIRDAVIAVPSFFTDLQRNRIAQAVKVAGLNLIQIIDDKDVPTQCLSEDDADNLENDKVEDFLDISNTNNFNNELENKFKQLNTDKKNKDKTKN